MVRGNGTTGSTGMYNSEKKMVASSCDAEYHRRLDERDIDLDRRNMTAVIYSGREDAEVRNSGLIRLNRLRARSRGRYHITLVTNDWLFLRYDDISDDMRGISVIACVSDPVNIRNMLSFDCILDGMNGILGFDNKDVTEKDVGVITDGIVRECAGEMLRAFSFDEICAVQKRMQNMFLSQLNENIIFSHLGLKVIDVRFDMDVSRAPALTQSQMENISIRMDNYASHDGMPDGGAVP